MRGPPARSPQAMRKKRGRAFGAPPADFLSGLSFKRASDLLQAVSLMAWISSAALICSSALASI